MADKKALHITKEAKDNTFVDCDIEGAKIDGRGTQMIRTTIFNFRKKYPNLWVGIIATLLVTVVGGVVLLLIEYGYFVK